MSKKSQLLSISAVLLLSIFSPVQSEAADSEPVELAVESAPLQENDTGCNLESFLTVTGDAANANYADPYLNVRCVNGLIMVEANGIPNFEFVQITPNGLQEINHHWQIPANPVPAESTTEVPLLGPIAITVTGMPIFGPTEAPRDNFADPFLDQILDFCNGHTAQGGYYHFHARPDCLFENIEGNPALVMGYAFDGYPIMAPYICLDESCSQVQKVESSYQRVSDSVFGWEAHAYVEESGDLDECNGRTDIDGQYRYYATDTFPYIIGCYRGVVNTANWVGNPIFASDVLSGNFDFSSAQPGGQPPQGPHPGGQPPNGQPPQGNAPPPRQ